jgi:histone H1/5
VDSAGCKGSRTLNDPRIVAIPDIHGHAKGEHKPYAEERPIAYSARMLFLWFYHACRRGAPRFMMVSDHINYLTFEDPAAVNLVRRALKLAEAGDLYGAAETAGVDVAHAAVVSEGMRKGMRFSIGAEIDNDPRARPDAQNIVDAMKPDGMIRSVHFLTIEHPEKGADFAWAFDNEEFVSLWDHVGVERTWELYMAALVEAIEKLPGQIVGHFYIPATHGHWPAQIEKYEDQLIAACAEHGRAIEINTRFLYRDYSEDQKKKFLDANRRLLKKAKAKDVGIAVGSAAHSPKDQGGAFETVLKLLDDADINELVFPVAGRLLRVALRATKEHLERKAAVTETPLPGSSISGFSRAELTELNDGVEPEMHITDKQAKANAKVKAAAAKARAATNKERFAAEARAAKEEAKQQKIREREEKAAAAIAAKEAKTIAIAQAKAKALAAKEKEKERAAVAKAKAAAAKEKAKEKAVAAKAKVAAAKEKAREKAAAMKAKIAAAKAKAAAKKAAKKPAPAKKAPPAKKPAPKKVHAKKAAPAKKAPVKKIAAKKSAPAKKKAPLKKAAVKKAPAKKALPQKKTGGKAKPAPKKAPAKKVAPKKKTPAKRR